MLESPSSQAMTNLPPRSRWCGTEPLAFGHFGLHATQLYIRVLSQRSVQVPDYLRPWLEGKQSATLASRSALLFQSNPSILMTV